MLVKNHAKLRPGVVQGAVAAAVVCAAGVIFLLVYPATWAASSSLVVLPSRQASAQTTVSLYDTLSQGQVPATYAELFRAQRFDSGGPTGSASTDSGAASVAVNVVPDTSVIAVTATAPSPDTAVRVADDVAARCRLYAAGMSAPYTFVRVSGAAGTATRQGLGTFKSFGLIGVTALIAGLLVQQGWQAWSGAGRQSAGLSRPNHRPPPRANGDPG